MLFTCLHSACSKGDDPHSAGICRHRALLHRSGPGPLRQAGGTSFICAHRALHPTWRRPACGLASVYHLACTTLARVTTAVGVPPLQVLLLAWKMRAKRMGYFSREEFQTGAPVVDAIIARQTAESICHGVMQQGCAAAGLLGHGVKPALPLDLQPACSCGSPGVRMQATA
jgi:hypothetical protein